MKADDKRLMDAQDAAVDAVAYWARTGQLYFSMKDKVEKYFGMHDKMVGATDTQDKLDSRKRAVDLLSVVLLFPMHNLNERMARKAVDELNRIAEDIPEKRTRGMHR